MLQDISRAITAFLANNNNPLGLSLLLVSAMLEYLFPPFPGDTVTLFGAVLVAQYGWDMPMVFFSVLAGSGAGAMVDFYVGKWLGKRYRAGKVVRGERGRARVEQLLSGFRRHGEAYVALNRFLPGVRAIFFLAAGMAELRPLRVLFFALVSAAAWNTLILAAGYAVGANWDRLRALARTYSLVVWGVLGLVGAVLLVRALWRRRR